MPLKPSTITTEADLLVNLLKDVKEISFADASKELGVPVETIEAWASFLEEERIVSVKYKFTTPYLAYLEPQLEKASQKTALKFFSDRKEQLSGSAEVEQIAAKSSEHLKSGEFKLANDTLMLLAGKLRNIINSAAKSKGAKSEEDELKLNEISERVKKAAELVAQGKFDIAKSIYDETLEKAKELLEKAREEKKEQEDVLVMQKQKTSDPNALLDMAYKMMEQGKLGEAKTVYNRLKTVYYNLPQDFLERKTELEQDMVKLNRDLAANMDRVQLKRMNEASSKIREQMTIAAGAIKRKDFEKANDAYKIIKEEFENLPEGFMAEKREMRSQIINLYEVLAVNRKRMLATEMAAKTMQIESMIGGIAGNMNSGNINGAIALYNQVQALYSSLPMGFLKEKIDLQKKILKVYYKLSSEYKKYNVKLTDSESAEISKMLADMNDRISKSNFQEAERIYGQVKMKYDLMPKGFLQEKTEMQGKILKAYSDLVAKSEEFTAKDISANIAEINRMIAEAENHLKNRQYDLAHKIYSDIIALYNNLPPGFIKSKADIRAKILSIYREITINYDQPFLKKADESADRAYHDILKRILEIHHRVGKGDLQALESGYSQIQGILAKTTLDRDKSTTLMREISKLGNELLLYRKVNSLGSIAAQRNFMKLKLELSQIARLKQRLKIESPEAKPLFDYVDKKFYGYIGALRQGRELPARTASFAKLKMKVPEEERKSDIYQKISSLKSSSAAQLDHAGGA